MPPKITRVRWSANNVPYGMVFSEITGVFSGKPEIAGEYIVPVTVETNYGKDTKDVAIKVEANEMPSGVYIASTQSNYPTSPAYRFSGNAKVNTYLFRRIDVPSPIKLVRHADVGLGIINGDGEYYCCGPYANKHIGDIYTNALQDTNDFMVSDTPINLYRTIKNWAGEALTTEEDEILSGVDRVIRVNGDKFSNANPVVYRYALILWNTQMAKAVIFPTKTQNFGSGSGWSQPSMTFDFSGISPNSGIEILGEPPIRDYPVEYLTDGGTKLGGVDLGYKAKKFFPKITKNSNSDEFQTLSENGYLDNDYSKFPYGIIKDAWSYYNFATYVQTMENKFYYYNHENKTWEFIGIADAQRVETSEKMLVILTKNGELYCHNDKGRSIPLPETKKGISYGEKIDNLTRLFPALTFRDFTLAGRYSSVTLVVLK